MTVLRREDVQSRVASLDEGPYRMASSPISDELSKKAAVHRVAGLLIGGLALSQRMATNRAVSE